MKNVNADFLLDIWADLKAKRLAPVAVGLALALVAMPALMLKGEDAPSASPLPMVATPAASGDEAQVEVADELAERGSKLDSYKAHDPFSGAVQSDDGDSGTSGTAVAPSDDAAAGAGGDMAAIIGLGGSPGYSPPDSAPGFGQPDPGGLTTPGGSQTPRVRRTNYTYELDVKFGRPGSEKRHPHLSRMSFLPNQKAPALLFMGVPADEKSAIFFVYPTLSHAGEGICLPSQEDCTFLELRVGRDHFLTLADHEYRVHLIDINRVKVNSETDQSRKAAGTRRSGRGDDGTPGDDGAAPEWPTIVDGIR
jgi:hypothetical protein